MKSLLSCFQRISTALSGVVAVFLLLYAAPAATHPVKILIHKDARSDGAYKFTFGGSTLTGLTQNVKDGDSAQDTGVAIADQINTVLGNFYTAMTSEEMIGTLTVQAVTITPKAGTDDFTRVIDQIPVGKKDPGQDISVQVVALVPGTSSFDLVATGTPDPTKFIDWDLFVADQSDRILGESDLLHVADTTAGTSVIDMFEADLVGQGLAVVASGASLSLTTDNNDFFILNRSDTGSLDPALSDAVPEPPSVTLFSFALALLGLFRCRVRTV